MKGKSTLIIIVAIFFFIAVVGGISYAFYSYNKEVVDVSLTSGEISLTIQNVNNSNFNILSAVPQSDNIGKVSSSYLDFTVTTKVDSHPVYYEVYIMPQTGNTLDTSYLKTYLTDQSENELKSVAFYNSLANSTKAGGKILYRGLVEVNNNLTAKTETQDFRLRLWLDSSYSETTSKTFNYDVYVYAYNVESDFVLPYAANLAKQAINAKVNAQTNSCNPAWVDDMGTANDESDDVIYFSGTNDCVDMNYVWYSGKLWRIVAIYPDGAMKLVTQNDIVTLAFNESGQLSFYTNANTTSYMYQWLNEDFYDTLYHTNNFIDTNKLWNITNSNASSVSQVSNRLPETTMVSSNAGLLNSYEYYNSYRCIESATCTGSSYGTGYLNIEYRWWLLNPENATYIWYVDNLGGVNCINPQYTRAVRPSIIIRSDVEFVGNGTSDNPYRIVGDKDTGNANELINTRLSGEYVKLVNNNSNQTFRIIGVEDNKTKIIAMDYAENQNTRNFATNSNDTLWGSGTTTDTDTWYDYLNEVDNNDINNTGYYDKLVKTYGDLFTSGTYYLGTSGYNYKLSVCANTTSGNIKVCTKTSDAGTFNIGLPRYGEMFATQQAGSTSNSIDMWLMNRYSNSGVWNIGANGFGYDSSPTTLYGARPTVYLKSTVKILSGSGTESDPYVVGI